MKSPRPGGTENISVSMPSELLGALRTRTGKRGVSAYVTAAVRHQLAMDGLARKPGSKVMQLHLRCFELWTQERYSLLRERERRGAGLLSLERQPA